MFKITMQNFDNGTALESENAAYPHGGRTRKGIAKFKDGKLRRVYAGIPDTYFSIPANARVNGKYVSGFLSVDADTLTFHESVYSQVKAVYDNADKHGNAETIDRYTIVLKSKQGDFFDCLGVSRYPDDANGFSQWDRCALGDHLGRKIKFSSLPDNVYSHVIKRLKESE